MDTRCRESLLLTPLTHAPWVHVGMLVHSSEAKHLRVIILKFRDGPPTDRSVGFGMTVVVVLGTDRNRYRVLGG